MSLKKAYFAGGCFWCMEPPFSNLEGVKSVEAGYGGGDNDAPTYYDHADHRESIAIEYDPKKVSYEKLLDVFWHNIDPTDLGGQFADRGHSYKTAIFYQNDDEKTIAEKSKQNLANSGKFKGKFVTEIVPYKNFYPAEEEHQQYSIKNPVRYQLYKEGSGRADFLNEKWGH